MEYHLLARESGSFEPVEPPPGLGLRVVRPRRGDWRRLLPLHIAYETEEVLLPGQRLNPNVSRSSLIESLAHQLVLVALRGNEPVARVATNARGFRNDQIGGVYTVPDLRGRGVARWLMGCLLSYIAADSHGASLFVKTHNEAALKLYDTLGFTFVCPFRIGYFR